MRENDRALRGIFGEDGASGQIPLGRQRVSGLRHSPGMAEDLLIELDRTEEQLQNGHSSLDQTRMKLQSLRNELAESQQTSEVGELNILTRFS